MKRRKHHGHKASLRIPEPYRTVINRVNARDCEFFTDHPGVSRYVRPYVEGEAWPEMHPGPGTVLVSLIGKNTRARAFFFPDEPNADQ